MHERTLLYSALGVTALAAIYGVTQVRGDGVSSPVPITPVSVLDATNTVARAEVPIRLTSSDGTGLTLVGLRANAVVEDPLALTELHLVFENPEDRVLEGTFRITLPQGASLSRFAMKVHDTWQEGEVVEKQAARRAYEDFLHRRQDPALMEQGAGNEFSARVFPIPARGRKEIKIAYTEVMEAGAPYVLPLRGLPQLGTLDVDVHAAGAKNAEHGARRDAAFGLHQARFTPAADFVVDAKQLPRSAGLKSGELAIARVVPFSSSRPEPVGSAVILFDTSASRGLGLAEQVKLLESTLHKLPGDTQLTVACFDQEVAPIYEGKASGFGPKHAKAILDRGALGASDVEGALAWTAEQARRAKAKRVIVLGDGVATAGETDAQKLRTKVEALRDAGVERMDAVAVGGIRDDAFLRTVVRGVLDKDGVVLDGKLGADAVARRLAEATSSGVPVKIEGAAWSWPDKLDGLQAGDEVMVYAQIDPQKPFRVTVGTQELAPDLRTTERPLVERAWAQAKIGSLLEAPKDGAAATKAEIVRLSTQHRVLSPHTAMLVLETDQDYQRFGIDRNATVDILTVQDGRIALAHSPRTWATPMKTALGEPFRRRTSSAENEQKGSAAAAPAAAAASAAAPPPPVMAEAERPDDDAPAEEDKADVAARNEGGFGSGGLGLHGTGAGGGGTGDGVGLGGLGGPGRGGAAASTLGSPAAEPLDLAAAPSPRPRREPAPTSPSPTRDEAPIAQVRPGTLVVERGISEAEAQRVVRSAVPAMRACYTAALSSAPSLRGRAELRVTVDAGGEVSTVEVVDAPASAPLRACMTSTFRSLRFPAPGPGGEARFTTSFDLVPLGGAPDDGLADARPSTSRVPKALPYEGRFKVVMQKLAAGDKESALAEANQWRADQPGDVLALVALGEALEAKGDVRTAARAYGSILELFSFRADSRRFAGERLERLDDARALALAVDTYGKAVEQRPDHPASHRLYAFALLKKGEHERAFEALKKGATRGYPPGRFAGVDRILKEDLGLVAAAWQRAQPDRASEIARRLRDAGGTEESGPSLRFVLNWETDANDVDFHIHDSRGGHAYYADQRLPSGGELYADVTTGYGPECFTIRGSRERRAHPYVLQAHYYSRGPMGYGMGKLQIIEHDGKGNLSFEERPFVVMVDRGYVDLGSVERARPFQTASLK